MRQLYFTFIAFLFSIGAFAQSSTPSMALDWGFTTGSTGYDYITELLTDSAGYIYACGKFIGTADFDPGPGVFNMTASGPDDAYVLKLDSASNLIWALQFGGPGRDRGHGLTLDDEGNVYVAGEFEDSIDLDPGASTYFLNSDGNDASFIAKVDNNGNFIWGRALTSDTHVRIYDIGYDHVGGIAITGDFEDLTDFDPGPGAFILNAPINAQDAFIMRLDTAGNFQWANSLDGAMDMYPTSVATDTLGNIYAGGDFRGTVDFDPGAGTFYATAFGFHDAYVVKLDSGGNFIWANIFTCQFGGMDADVRDLTVDSQGDLFIVGTFEDSLDIDPGPGQTFIGNGGYGDGYVAKFQPNGSLLWGHAIGAGVNDRANAVCTDKYGNVFVGGTFMNVVDFDPGPGVFELASNNGWPAAYCVSFDGTGNFRWAADVGGPPPGSPSSRSYGDGVAADNDDRVYTAGHFRGIVDLDPSAATPYDTAVGLDDIFFQKLKPCFIDSTIDTVVACNTYTWIDGVTYTINSNSNVYHTLINSTGCDSVIKLQLALIPTSTGVDTQTTCTPFTWINGVTYTSSNFQATHTYLGGATSGCDSIVTLNLTYTPVTATDTRIACDSLVWVDGNVYTSNNNTATYLYPSGAANHCDSMVTLDLTITNSASGTDVQAACNSFTWLDGITYTSDNDTATYTLIGGAANGCDSVLTLDLTINSVDVTTSTAQFTITANASGATYQWLDCDDNFATITGQTAQTFTATSNGNYAVQITQNGCVDTSACVNVTGIGMAANEQFSSVTIYPNPAREKVFIDLGDLKGVDVKMFNVAGQLLYSESNINASLHSIQLIQAPGVYFVEVSISGESKRFRLLLE